jgi:pentalenolactone synthase
MMGEIMDLAQLPFDQQDPLQIPREMRALQAAGVIHRVRTMTGHDAWLITSHEEVQRLLADSRIGLAHSDPANAPRAVDSVLFGGPRGEFETEHADSLQFRAFLRPHFSPRHLRSLQTRAEALTDELLDSLATRSGPVDLIEALAFPLPILVICELLGVPYSDRDQFRAWSRAAGDLTDRDRADEGLASLFGYGQQLVASKRLAPGDDVISRMCQTEGIGDMDIAQLAMGLLFAGHETTASMIGIGAMFMLANPSQWQAVLADPDLVPGAVEEILRAPGDGGGGIVRYAREDLEIAGTSVRKGDLLMLDTVAANHDPLVFKDPDRFDVTRQSSAHMTFGHGLHYCVGAPLARVELQAVFSKLVPRFPGMRLAVPVEELTLRTGSLSIGPVELPVTW